MGKLLLKNFAFLLEATLNLCQLGRSLGPRLLSALLHCLFLCDLQLERANLLRRPAIFLIRLLQPTTHRLDLSFQLAGDLGQRLLRGLAGPLFLRHPLLQGGNLFDGTPVLLVGFFQPTVRRIEFSFQLGGGLGHRLLRGLAGPLFLRYPLLERADLLRRPAIFLIRLLQPTTHRLDLSFQANEVLRCFIRGSTVSLLLLAQLRHLLLKRRLFLLEMALGLLQLPDGLALALLRHLASPLFLRHPLLERADLLSHPAIFLRGLLQLLSDHCQLITQSPLGLIKRAFKLLH